MELIKQANYGVYRGEVDQYRRGMFWLNGRHNAKQQGLCCRGLKALCDHALVGHSETA